jgi:hypothetical protein
LCHSFEAIPSLIRLFLTDLISLGGGLPPSEYFPFDEISFKIRQPPHFFEVETKKCGKIATAGKYDIREGISQYGDFFYPYLALTAILTYAYRLGSCPQLWTSDWFASTITFCN